MSQHWTNDHREWYRNVYLQSDHWRELRGRKLSANPMCERCARKACDVHHVRYRNILDVELGDLLSLCRPCHDEEHRINGNPKRVRPNLDKEFQDARWDAIRKRKARRQQVLARGLTPEQKKARNKQWKRDRFAKKYPMLARKKGWI